MLLDILRKGLALILFSAQPNLHFVCISLKDLASAFIFSIFFFLLFVFVPFYVYIVSCIVLKENTIKCILLVLISHCHALVYIQQRTFIFHRFICRDLGVRCLPVKDLRIMSLNPSHHLSFSRTWWSNDSSQKEQKPSIIWNSMHINILFLFLQYSRLYTKICTFLFAWHELAKMTFSKLSWSTIPHNVVLQWLALLLLSTVKY